MTTLHDLRKVLAFGGLVAILVFSGFGDDTVPKLTFTSETGLAFIYGEAEEIVYKSQNGTDLFSLLVYPIPPGLGVYVGLEARWGDSFLARIRMETAWPLMSGNLSNDDWIHVSSFSHDPDVHSDSTAFLTSWLHGELEFGFPDSKPSATVETLFGLTFRHLSWEGWDAYQVSDLPAYTTGEIFGYVIDYRQNWYIPWIGMTIGHQNTASIFAASFRFSPWTHVVGRDVHMARPIPTTFIDIMHGGVMISGGLRGKIRLTENLWLTCKMSFDYCRGARGDTFIYLVGSPTVNQYANTGGAALSLFSSYLGFSIHP